MHIYLKFIDKTFAGIVLEIYFSFKSQAIFSDRHKLLLIISILASKINLTKPVDFPLKGRG
jgi:hypothetical protein